MIERWLDIKGFEGLYQVSNIGNVKSLSRMVKHSRCGVYRPVRERILCYGLSANGYKGVVLAKEGSRVNFSVHRLVANAFIPNPENKTSVNHINGIKTDCRAVNLEWSTHSENMRHAFDTGLSNPTKNLGKYYRQQRQTQPESGSV